MKVVFALTSTTFRSGPHGVVRVVTGEAWAGNDPFVAAHPELFTDSPPAGLRHTTEIIESATARPGELRPRKGGGKAAK